MHLVNRTPLILLLICAIFITSCYGKGIFYFTGYVNTDNVNIRADSTVSSKIICTIDKGESVEVLLEAYGWYKIILPKNAPAFVNKDLLSLIDNKTAKILKDKVNIRLQPNETSPILGKLNKDAAVTILQEEQGWYKIRPNDATYGWINKRFIDRINNATPQEKPQINILITKEQKTDDKIIVVEGILKPKFMTSVATHKLIDKDGNIFLVKAAGQDINNLGSHKVRVTGEIISHQQKHLIIELLKIEAID